jgi:o-succinylbenzoate synthase
VIDGILIDHLRINRFWARPYDLPLRRDWQSARGGFQRRRGWLVCVEADGISGFGDCAPIPVAGTEGFDAAESALLAIERRAPGEPSDELIAMMDEGCAAVPAARFAIECALLDLRSQARGVPLRTLLAETASDHVAVNGILGPLSTLGEDDLQACAEAGFRVMKIKVGLDAPRSELTHLTLLASSLPPETRLRLDANGAWNHKEAHLMIERLSRLPIESLEEPLRIPDPSHLRALQSEASFPLALDESMSDVPADADLRQLGVRRIVIKPVVLGGLMRALDRSTRAAQAGVEVVVTSVVESAAGLWPTAQLAAATGSRIPHGLATADWLAADLGGAPRPIGGRLWLPDRPGSGFKPHPA